MPPRPRLGGRASGLDWASAGGVPEWLKGAVLKTARPRERLRGFESHPRRLLIRAWLSLSDHRASKEQPSARRLPGTPRGMTRSGTGLVRQTMRPGVKRRRLDHSDLILSPSPSNPRRAATWVQRFKDPQEAVELVESHVVVHRPAGADLDLARAGAHRDASRDAQALDQILDQVGVI